MCSNKDRKMKFDNNIVKSIKQMNLHENNIHVIWCYQVLLLFTLVYTA